MELSHVRNMPKRDGRDKPWTSPAMTAERFSARASRPRASDVGKNTPYFVAKISAKKSCIAFQDR
jgi:hypothetical protein